MAKLIQLTVNDEEYNGMQNINVQSSTTAKEDVVSIVISPNEFIVCGGDDVVCAILIRNDEIKENILLLG